MENSLTKEVKELAILVTKELQKRPGQVTPEMLMALRGCAQVLDAPRSQAYHNSAKVYYAGAVNWNESEKITFRTHEYFGMTVINDECVCTCCHSKEDIKPIIVVNENDVVTSVRSCKCGNLIFARNYLKAGTE